MMWANINNCPKKHSAHSNHGSDTSELNTSTGKLGPSQSFANLHTIAEENHRDSMYRPASAASDHFTTGIDHDSNEYRSSLIVYADCQSASRGLFGEQF